LRYLRGIYRVTVEKEESFGPRPEIRMPQIRTNILLAEARILVRSK
jgi:hypothetical protein